MFKHLDVPQHGIFSMIQKKSLAHKYRKFFFVKYKKLLEFKKCEKQFAKIDVRWWEVVKGSQKLVESGKNL